MTGPITTEYISLNSSPGMASDGDSALQDPLTIKKFSRRMNVSPTTEYLKR